MNYPIRPRRILKWMKAACAAGILLPINLASSPLELEWIHLPPMPEPAGLKGFFVLDSGSSHLLMGGSSFPTPPSEGGRKAYFDTIYSLFAPDTDRAAWKRISMRLPCPAAGGLSIPTEDGTVLIGGRNEEAVLDQVVKVSWSEGHPSLKTQALPSLPKACFYPAGTQYENRLYVAGGHDGSSGLSSFRMLDLADPSNGWKTLPAWPGPPLFGATLEVLNDGYKDYLYLFSGKSRNTTPRSRENYSRAVYRFDPDEETWEDLGVMPRAALLGIPMKVEASSLIIMGGSDGHDIERLDQIMESYRLPSDILLYSAKSNTWQIIGNMPRGLAGAVPFRTDDGYILASGEYAPARRTSSVYLVRIKKEATE